MEFVAEFTTNHLGNLNLLLVMVERAAASGCTSIKMQKKEVDSFYDRAKLDAPYVSPYGKTYGDYRRIFEFDEWSFRRFDDKCKEVGVRWFATAQDMPSLRFLLQFDLGTYKFASINARNFDFLRQAADLVPAEKRIVVSVAGSSLREVGAAISIFGRHAGLVINHCVAQYPCPPECLKLGNIRRLKQLFETERVKIGYSGHEVGVEGTLAAAELGVSMIERHFCLTRSSFAHHIDCSLEPDEFKAMTEAVSNKVPPARLPEAAYYCDFGMSDGEADFLTLSRRL